MAAPYTQLNAITYAWVKKAMTDQVYNTNALLKLLYEQRVKLDGGTKIGVPVIMGSVDSTTGTWYSGMDQLSDAQKEDLTRAEVDWKQIFESVLLSRADILKNSGSKQILNLLKSKIEIAQFRLKSKLGTGVNNDGTNALAFNGLQEIIDNDNTYAGIAYNDIQDEAGSNSWLSYVDANGGTARTVSHALIQKTRGRATFDADAPDYAHCRQNVLDEVINILAPHQRLMTDDKMSKLGFDGVLKYAGMSWLVDSHAEAAAINKLNLKHLKMYVHQDEDMRVERFDKLETQNGIRHRVLLMGNLLCDGRRYLSKLDDISVAA